VVASWRDDRYRTIMGIDIMVTASSSHSLHLCIARIFLALSRNWHRHRSTRNVAPK